MSEITVEATVFQNPTWSVGAANPNDTVTLRVEAPGLTAEQVIIFRIHQADRIFDVLQAASGATTAEWSALNFSDNTELQFDAILRETPSPANGHQTVRAQTGLSPVLTVAGFRVEATSIDEAFVPNQEQLEVQFRLHGTAPASGRYEVWGERYPTDQPVYTEDFVPAAGNTTWNTWNGGGITAGPLNGQFLTPEFTPYRIKIIVGPDAASIQDPYGNGKGKVSIAERQFDVTFQSVHVRLQRNLDAAVQNTLNDVLWIEPRTDKGEYVAQGRIPLETEPAVAAGWAPATPGAPAAIERPGVGRIRIPCVRHSVIGESLNQGFSNVAGVSAHRIADPYMGDNRAPLAGAGRTAYNITRGIYTRPEIPLDFEPRLRSRVAGNNQAPNFGLFEASAVGPAIFDAYANDIRIDAIYTTQGTPQSRVYFRNADHKVKRGKHDGPYNSGGNPVFSHWQAYFQVAGDGDRNFDVSTVDPGFSFGVGNNELTVYLNRTKLTLAGTALDGTAHPTNRPDGSPYPNDYAETNNTTIRLKEGLTKSGDVLWIVRAEPGLAAVDRVARWRSDTAAQNSFNPGTNCHEYYGGIRCLEPTNDLVGVFRSDFSAAPAGTEPIIGKGGAAFPYRDNINLNPMNVDAAKRERVESQAVTAAGDQRGLAGIIFSPSYIGGDNYVIEASLRGCSYARDPGFVTARAGINSDKSFWCTEPWGMGHTGRMDVWRGVTISRSVRRPGIGDNPMAGRTHPADGERMMVSNLDTFSRLAFAEWIVPPPGGAGTDPHQDASLPDYRTLQNTALDNNFPAHARHPKLNADADVNDYFVRWDHYRSRLPPGIPNNRRNIVSNAIATVPHGGTANAAMVAAQAAITGAAGLADAALDPGVTAITQSPAGWNRRHYKSFVKGRVKTIAYTVMDDANFIPQENPPRSMKVLRWQRFYKNIWDRGAPGAMGTVGVGTAGFCRGNSQIFSTTVSGNPDTFEHEMGHSFHLVHFCTSSARNSCWKHHDHQYPQCKLGYINQPRDSVTGAPTNYTVSGVTVGPAINLNTGIRIDFCAKCLLEMRGWNDEILSCNWDHPGVF